MRNKFLLLILLISYNAYAQYVRYPAAGGGGGGITIGSPVLLGTAGSVLFIDHNGNIGQDNSNFFYADTSHRLGIGTTTPANPLDVFGSVAIGTYGGTNAAPANSLIVSGKIGVGTTSPGQSLDVRGNIEILSTGKILPTADATNAINIANAAGTVQESFDTTNGRLGIGTTVPGQPLSVGSGATSGFGSTAQIAALSSSNAYVTTVAGGVETFLGSDGTGGIIGTLTNVSLIFRQNNVERMRFNTSGNLGIGTQTPVNLLDVSGSEAIGTYAGVSTAPSNSLIVSGKVGIGTSNPGQLLSIINSNAEEEIGFTTTSTASALTTIGGGTYLEIGAAEYNLNSYRIIAFGYRFTGSIAPAYVGYQETDETDDTFGDLVFGTRNVGTNTTPSERLRITSTGNVGIGTTGPHSALEVNGGVQLNTSTSRPTCVSSLRGLTWVVESASGTTDNYSVCLKSAADTYNWIQIVTGG